jgi:hypothetical protein
MSEPSTDVTVLPPQICLVLVEPYGNPALVRVGRADARSA